MKSESDETWIRDRMKELRQHEIGSGPSFDQVRRRARAQRASRLKPTPPAWRLVCASSMALLVLIAAFSWSAVHRQRAARIERNYAEMDGVLLTSWQAPSDTLFPTGNNEGPIEE